MLRGECLIFQGNVLHAGSKYSDSNRQLFFEAISIRNCLPPELDGQVTVFKYCCPNRHFSFKTMKEKEYHNSSGNCSNEYLNEALNKYSNVNGE